GSGAARAVCIYCRGCLSPKAAGKGLLHPSLALRAYHAGRLRDGERSNLLSLTRKRKRGVLLHPSLALRAYTTCRLRRPARGFEGASNFSRSKPEAQARVLLH